MCPRTRLRTARMGELLVQSRYSSTVGRLDDGQHVYFFRSAYGSNMKLASLQLSKFMLQSTQLSFQIVHETPPCFSHRPDCLFRNSSLLGLETIMIIWWLSCAYLAT